MSAIVHRLGMKASRARRNASGPTAAAMNGRRRPRGVWKSSLQGPITSGSVRATTPSEASTSAISVVELVNSPSSGGRYAAVVVSDQARPSAPTPRRSDVRAADRSDGDGGAGGETTADDVDDRALCTRHLLVTVGQLPQHPARENLLQASVENPARQARVHVRPEDALRLTPLDHALDH